MTPESLLTQRWPKSNYSPAFFKTFYNIHFFNQHQIEKKAKLLHIFVLKNRKWILKFLIAKLTVHVYTETCTAFWFLHLKIVEY